MTNGDQLRQEIRASCEAVASLEGQLEALSAAIDLVIATLDAGGKLLSAGNGGSAAEALHLSEELVGRFRGDRRSLPAICLAADPTALTCIANDFGYNAVFARQVEGLGVPGDLLVLFTTSGRSSNLPPAIAAARERGVKVLCLLGRDGGDLKGQGDCEIMVRGDRTERIQEAHQVVVHLLLSAIEAHFA